MPATTTTSNAIELGSRTAATPIAPTTTARDDRAGDGRRAPGDHAADRAPAGPAVRPARSNRTSPRRRHRGAPRMTTGPRIGWTNCRQAATPTAPPSVSVSSWRTMNGARRRARRRGRRPPTAAAHPAVTAARSRSATRRRPRRGRPARATGGATTARRRGGSRRTVVEAISPWPIVASVTETSDAAGARSGATAPSTPVTTAPTSEIRSSTESAVVLGEGGVHDGRGPPDRPGQGVAAGDADRDRLDERAQRHEVRVGRDQLVGDPDADLRGDVVVLAQLVDVVDERRAVEHVAVDVAGDDAEGSEEGTEDEQDACRPPSPATARRARRRARVARSRCSRDRQVDQPAGGVGDGQRCAREQEDASEADAERRGEAGEEQRRRPAAGS